MMTTKERKIASFDPSQPGLAEASIYGLPFTAEESEIIVVPVPWEVTVSYGTGASLGPEAIMNASYQVDLLHQEYPDLWKLGIYMDHVPEDWIRNNEQYRKLAQNIIQAMEAGKDVQQTPELRANLATINQACETMNDALHQRVSDWLSQEKKVILLGGDHSTPLGYYRALADQYTRFGILHLDAHMDLRNAYEGFTYSHASIMYNALQLPQVNKLIQVGIRDFSEEEITVVKSSDKISVFTDSDLKTKQFEGQTWQQQVDEIIGQLPQNVAISLDIDALQGWYCPHTGTPVPGGLSYEQVIYLLSKLGRSDKNIIGIDLVEVAPGGADEWDGNVGARLLFHLCGVLARNNGLDTGTPILF